jgi:hypothetical protein
MYVGRLHTMSELEQPKPRVVTFKRHAHLLTLISIVWTVFTVLAIFFVSDNREPDYRVYVIPIGIWVLHAVCIGLSIYFWRAERESVLMVQDDGDRED